jgi:nitrate reductase NapAB chaperone NapD
MNRVHIAGMLVQARPEAIEAAMALAQTRGAVVHPTGIVGKFAAVLETDHEGEIASVIDALQAAPGVIAVSMTAHYLEDADALSLEMDS